MRLKKSWVYRNSAHAGRTNKIDADWHMPETGTKDMGVEFRFDMGTADKSELLAMHIHHADFELIARFMAEADREKAIQAFSKALIKIKPVKPS